MRPGQRERAAQLKLAYTKWSQCLSIHCNLWALLQSEKDADVDIIYKHTDTVMDAGEGVLEREEQAGKWLLASAYNEHDGVIYVHNYYLPT